MPSLRRRRASRRRSPSATRSFCWDRYIGGCLLGMYRIIYVISELFHNTIHFALSASILQRVDKPPSNRGAVRIEFRFALPPIRLVSMASGPTFGRYPDIGFATIK